MLSENAVHKGVVPIQQIEHRTVMPDDFADEPDGLDAVVIFKAAKVEPMGRQTPSPVHGRGRLSTSGEAGRSIKPAAADHRPLRGLLARA